MCALLDGVESPEERDIRALVKALQQHFNMAELRRLAFEVNVDHEDLPGETRSDRARELALPCRRQGRLAALAERVRGERPLRTALDDNGRLAYAPAPLIRPAPLRQSPAAARVHPGHRVPVSRT